MNYEVVRREGRVVNCQGFHCIVSDTNLLCLAKYDVKNYTSFQVAPPSSRSFPVTASYLAFPQIHCYVIFTSTIAYDFCLTRVPLESFGQIQSETGSISRFGPS